MEAGEDVWVHIELAQADLPDHSTTAIMLNTVAVDGAAPEQALLHAGCLESARGRPAVPHRAEHR